jgi:hypothetical protein
MPRWPAGLIALALLPLGGCAGGDQPTDSPLVVISGPKAFERFELRDERQEVIWLLVADEPAPLAQLVYGDVPAGFRQETPAHAGRPRDLMPGEPLALESVTPLRIFHHEGFAADSQRFEIDTWEMRLRHPPARPEVDGAPGVS